MRAIFNPWRARGWRSDVPTQRFWILQILTSRCHGQKRGGFLGRMMSNAPDASNDVDGSRLKRWAAKLRLVMRSRQPWVERSLAVGAMRHVYRGELKG